MARFEGLRPGARKRRYVAAFQSKLNEAEDEAAETRTGLRSAVACRYLTATDGDELRSAYDDIMGKLVNMIAKPTPWILKKTNR